MIHDVRHALRAFVRMPGFTATAIVTLAVGIGANTAIFSVVYALLLKPLPFRSPDQLVYLHDTSPALAAYSMSWPKFVALRDGNRSLSALAAMAAHPPWNTASCYPATSRRCAFLCCAASISPTSRTRPVIPS